MPGSSRDENAFQPLSMPWVSGQWRSRFGTPEEIFYGYSFFLRARNIWAISDSALPDLRYEALGMRIMSMKNRPWKPTTSALQMFGRHATRNLVVLDREEAWRFLSGGSLRKDCDAEPGYVVVSYGGDVLGCGLYSSGRLVSQIPKHLRLLGDI